MVVKKSTAEKIFDCFNYLFLTFLMLICFYPVLHILASSFSDPSALTRHVGAIFLPLGKATIEGYKLVFKNPNIISGYSNTIYYLVLGTTINIVLTSLGAYVLSRKNVLFGKYIMFMIIFTMYFSGGLIPWYLQMKQFGLMNNIWAMVLPNAISTYNLIVMRTSFAAIPQSLEESAKIDGANDFTILIKIILPLSKAVIAVMILFYAVTNWNSWFNAMILLKDKSKFPLQLILREVLIQNDTNTMQQGMKSVSQINLYKDLIKYCTIMVGTVPIFFIYPFIQKYFTKGVMIGSLKE